MQAVDEKLFIENMTPLSGKYPSSAPGLRLHYPGPPLRRGGKERGVSVDRSITGPIFLRPTTVIFKSILG